jgi:hypothetical protein
VLEWICETYPETDENVIRAHVLRGVLLEEQNRGSDAMVELERANSLADKAGLSSFAIAYVDMASYTLSAALDQKKDLDTRRKLLVDARGYAAAAVTRDPALPAAYSVLGSIELILLDLGDSTAWNARANLDRATSMAQPGYLPLWNRAAALDKAPGASADNLAQAAADRKRALYELRHMPGHYRARAGAYILVADDLIRQFTSTRDETGPSATESVFYYSFIQAGTGGGADPLPLWGWRTTGDEIALRKQALLTEACELLHTADQAGNDADWYEFDLPKLLSRVQQINDERAQLSPVGVTPCVMDSQPTAGP